MSLSGKVLGIFTVHDEEGPKPTKEEELRAQADRHVDLTINMLGTAAAEVLELHNQQLFGRSLRDTLLERELAKLTAELEQKKERARRESERRRELEALAEKEIVNLYGKNYFLDVDGERLKALPKLEVRCPHCGTPHTRPRGALIELYEWRRQHGGLGDLAGPPPVKQESVRCGQCEKGFSYRAQLII